MDSATVSKLSLVNGSFIYVCIQWHEKSFEATLFDDNGVYTGKFTEENVIQFSQSLEEDIDTYFDKIKGCLCKQNEDYIYDLAVVDNEKTHFVWKYKKIVRYGKIELTRSNQVKDALIDRLILKVETLTSKNLSLEAENKELKLEVDQYDHDLKELAKSKVDLEVDLYSKFVLLLNAKKRKIQELMIKETSGDTGSSLSSQP